MINRNFKKCLITGIGGSGASYLAEYLLDVEPNLKIIGLARRNKVPTNLSKNVKIIQCNMNNFIKLKNIIKKNKPDLIYNFASDANVGQSFVEPRKIILNNNNSCINLFEAIRLTRNYKPLIISISTSEVYGLVKKDQTPIVETCQYNPANPYAVSKTFQDLLSQNYVKNFDFKIIITRMFSYLNPRRLTLFASNWAKQIVDIENKKIKLLKHGNLNSVRTIISTYDMCNAYYLAAKKGRVGEIYNIGSTYPIKISKILKKLINLSKEKRIKKKLDKNLLRKTDVTLQIPNISKFQKHTNWSYAKENDLMYNDLLDYFRINKSDSTNNK